MRLFPHLNSFTRTITALKTTPNSNMSLYLFNTGGYNRDSTHTDPGYIPSSFISPVDPACGRLGMEPFSQPRRKGIARKKSNKQDLHTKFIFLGYIVDELSRGSKETVQITTRGYFCIQGITGINHRSKATKRKNRDTSVPDVEPQKTKEKSLPHKSRCAPNHTPSRSLAIRAPLTLAAILSNAVSLAHSGFSLSPKDENPQSNTQRPHQPFSRVPRRAPRVELGLTVRRAELIGRDVLGRADQGLRDLFWRFDSRIDTARDANVRHL